MKSFYDWCIENNKENLLIEWCSENNNISPTDLTKGSNKKVWWVCPICKGKWQATVYDRTRENSTGCPYCASQKVLKGYNDLATKYPEAVKQWHPTKNGKLKPTDVMSRSSKKVWWICSQGHEFEQSISARTKHISSCPICSGQKVLIGYNDMASKYPQIAKEWNYNKNGEITPQDITWGSNKKFWWVCSVCGYEWQARVSDRTREGNGCPACANKVLVVGFNDLETNFPEIAKEWHPTKNKDLKPKDVKYCSLQKVWWQCSNGHEFFQSIGLRISRKHNCPICSNNTISAGYNDLATTNPEIAKEWHPTKNGSLKPTDVTAGSGRKVWWLCPNKHEYFQAIEKRTTRNQSCPYCSGHKVLIGFNDLKTINPQLAKEWHPTKNGSLKPTDVTVGSGKKVWWLCPNGHEFQAVVRDRSYGANCPICNIRNATSFPEQAILYYVKQLYPDTVSRYKDIFPNTMELDIYIPSINIAIEYDGAVWHKTKEQHNREIKKYDICRKNKIYLIRVRENGAIIKNDIADSIFYIKKIKRSCVNELENVINTILSRISKTNEHNININIKKDKYNILNYVYKIENSLLEKRPDVAKQWNYEKNVNLKPEMFSVSSNEIVWWKCLDCGKEWESSINSMTREGRVGCPICANKQRGITFTKGIVKKVGSLAENIPELAKEWHPTKNGNLTPNDITTGRFKPVWWLCSKCGHEWQASTNIRKRGIGCPCCSGRVPKIGVNDFATLHPELLKEWNYSKNIGIKPNTFLSGSGKKVWWKCSFCGKEWLAKINSRVKSGKLGCHSCNLKKGKKKLSQSVLIITFIR